MSEQRSAVEQAVDILVYAPLGLVLTVRDELPRLIDKGRRQASGQLSTARLLGQLAVGQGQKEADKMLKQAAQRLSELGLGAPSPNGASPSPSPPATAASPTVPPAQARPASVSADSLAIPGYDVLSAPQVVQRLDGLSADELEAVRAYETATRHRRTILSRIAQLQPPPT
ncbi:MAG: hypothetical protein M3N68_07970 [Actinomycetota bacterium]|nr:hypothetical protein [Actinomycetota bacterium]